MRKNCTNQHKLLKSDTFSGGGGGETQLYGPNDFIDIWAFLKIRDVETAMKIKYAFFERGGRWGQRGELSPNAVFLGKRHDNKISNLKV